MTVLKIVEHPDPLLKKVSTPVEKIDKEIMRQLDDMLETMYAAKGVGLAAVQVGILKRMLVLDVSRKNKDGAEERSPMFLINPEIISASEEKNKYEEGCLSIPGQYAEVERPAEVTVRFQDKSGDLQQVSACGLLATVIQHEIDHLNGILFIDRISKLKKDSLLRKYKKQQKAKQEAAENEEE